MNLENELLIIRPKLLSQAKRFYNFDIQSAEHLVSDTVERILKNKEKFEEGTNFNAWCHFILKNLFINDYRSTVRRREICVETDLDNENVLSKSYHEQADDNMRLADLMKLVDELPEIHKQSFLLSVEGYKYEEIAESLGVPIGTVKSRIFLARKILQERITKESNNLITIKSYNNLQEDNQMAKRIDKSEQLAKFFRMVYTTSDNHWTSVKDHPLTPMYKECGLDHNWGAAINYVLKNTKFFMVEGERGGMRYRSYTAVTPDFDALAKQVIEYKENQPDTPAKDLTNSNRPKVEKVKVIKTEIIKGRKHFNVDDICYRMHDNKIVEFEVTAVEKKNGVYLHRLQFKDEIEINDIPNNECFSSPESLSSYLLRHVLKLK